MSRPRRVPRRASAPSPLAWPCRRVGRTAPASAPPDGRVVVRSALRPAAWVLVVASLALTFAGASPGQGMLDIDTADAATLAATLPGIGPVKARRIVEHRERHGPFGSLAALEAVKGIGPATLERIRAHLASSAGGGAAARPSGASAGAARSTTELERAARAAVRSVVAGAHRDAERVRAGLPPQ